MKQVRVEISGKVQGVWFRAWTEREAVDLGISGWVRNRRDGVVEAIFSGSEHEVEEMIRRCWEGPRMARVTQISVEEWEAEVEPGFVVREDS